MWLTHAKHLGISLLVMATLMGVAWLSTRGLVLATEDAPAASATISAPSENSAARTTRQAGGNTGVKESAPVVIRTVPAAGDMEVDAAKVTEIRVTFSKDMKDNAWSWTQVSTESYPKTTGKPFYDKDKRTCVLPVKLEPGKAYVIWLNPQRFPGFRDTDGKLAVFYPLVFETKP